MGWANARGWVPLNRWFCQDRMKSAAANQAAGIHAVCSRTIRNTSHVDSGANTSTPQAPNRIGSTTLLASQYTACEPSGT